MARKNDSLQAIKEIYAEWMRYPNKAAREAAGAPPTKVAFSKQYQVDRSTMWDWEQDPEFARAVSNEALGILSVDDFTKMMEKLKSRAIVDGNIPAIKLLGEWSGLVGGKRIVEDKPQNQLKKDISAMSEEELNKFLEAEDEGD